MFPRNNSEKRVCYFGSGRSGRQASGRTRAGTEGTAAVEFALILPFLMLLLAGIIEYGWGFYVDLTLTNAAREGARAGVTQTTKPLVMTRAATEATNYLAAANLSSIAEASVNQQELDDNNNVEVSVTTNANFKPLVGYLPQKALPDSLSAVSTMRWEWAP
jgi:Flp pilus assembly protein TadG